MDKHQEICEFIHGQNNVIYSYGTNSGEHHTCVRGNFTGEPDSYFSVTAYEYSEDIAIAACVTNAETITRIKAVIRQRYPDIKIRVER